MINRRTVLASIAASLAVPALARSSETKDVFDLSYSDQSPRNLLDIYRPDGTGPFPALLDIHGGGFLTGDKRDLRVPRQVLDRGVAVIRMNYRLSSEARWPAQQTDVLSAAAFLQKHKAELGLTGKLAVGGRSAGAFLAVSAALSMMQAGWPPAAVVNFYGPMDFGSMDADMARLSLPVTRPPADSAESVESLLVGYAVGEKRQEATAMGPVGRLEVMAEGVTLPPLMVRHGLRDTIVSSHQAEHLRNAWHRVDPLSPIDFQLLPQEGHGTAAFGGDAVLGDLASFLTRHLAAEVSG